MTPKRKRQPKKSLKLMEHYDFRRERDRERPRL